MRLKIFRPVRYLVLIALAALIGDLAHIALDRRSWIPCIGASGGIAGVITFYALNSADATRFSDALGMGLVSLDSIACLVRFRSLDFVPDHRHSRAKGGNMSSLSSAAHLGGAAVGVVAWLVWGKPKEEPRLLE